MFEKKIGELPLRPLLRQFSTVSMRIHFLNTVFIGGDHITHINKYGLYFNITVENCRRGLRGSSPMGSSPKRSYRNYLRLVLVDV